MLNTEILARPCSLSTHFASYTRQADLNQQQKDTCRKEKRMLDFKKLVLMDGVLAHYWLCVL